MKSVPKYMALVNWVKDKIDLGELLPGDKLNTENELSVQFQMSRQTVRHAIGILDKEGIIERRQGSGNYISNLPLGRKYKNTKTIVIISTYINAYIFPNIIAGMERILTKEGYSIQIAFTHNKVEREATVLKGLLESDSVDGLIIEPTKSGIPNPNFHIYNEIIKRKIPTLFFNSYYPNLNLPHVSLDDRMAGYVAAKYLIDAGHQRIAGIFKSDDGQGQLRYYGYMNALMEARIKLRDENVVWIDTEDQRNFVNDERRVCKRLKDCTGCVCYNDSVAKDLEIICKKHGIRVPEDLSIVSIDNSELAEFCEVPLTSVVHPMDKLGEKTAENLLAMIQDYEFEGTLEFGAEIVERKSVLQIEPQIIKE